MFFKAVIMRLLFFEFYKRSFFHVHGVLYYLNTLSTMVHGQAFRIIT